MTPRKRKRQEGRHPSSNSATADFYPFELFPHPLADNQINHPFSSHFKVQISGGGFYKMSPDGTAEIIYTQRAPLCGLKRYCEMHDFTGMAALSLTIRHFSRESNVLLWRYAT